MKAQSYQWRVRWRTNGSLTGYDLDGRETQTLTSKLRYADRVTLASAESVAERLRGKAEEDHCECESDVWECGYCQGTERAPTDIAITRRQVGAWEAVA